MGKPFLEQHSKNFDVDVVAQRLPSNPKKVTEYEGREHINHVCAPQYEDQGALIHRGK